MSVPEGLADRESGVQYPAVDAMQDLQWVTAPTTKDIQIDGKPKIKVYPIAKVKPQDPSESPKGKGGKGRGKGKDKGGKGKGKKKGKPNQTDARANQGFWSVGRKNRGKNKGASKGAAKGGKARKVNAG